LEGKEKADTLWEERVRTKVGIIPSQAARGAPYRSVEADWRYQFFVLWWAFIAPKYYTIASP